MGSQTKFAKQIRAMLAAADAASTAYAKGRAFEQLLSFVVGSVPGAKVSATNQQNAAGSDEVDVVFWNAQDTEGLVGFDYIILAECKNWAEPVDSASVVVFAEKLKARCCRVGILFAARGITGDDRELTRAHDKIAVALREGYRILVITREEMSALSSPRAVVGLLQGKACQLAASATSLRSAVVDGTRSGTGIEAVRTNRRTSRHARLAHPRLKPAAHSGRPSASSRRRSRL